MQTGGRRPISGNRRPTSGNRRPISASRRPTPNGMRLPSGLSLRETEELICRKRNEDVLKREQWSGVTQYFQTWERVGNKYSSWTCDSYYNHVENLQKEFKKENEYKIKLDQRKEKLRQKLLEEKTQYDIELKDLSMRKKTSTDSDIYSLPLEDLHNVNIEMYRRQQESLRKQAELKQYLAWKANNPQLIEYNRQQNNNFVKRCWIDQIIEKQKQRELQEKENAKQELQRLRNIKQEIEKEEQDKEMKRQEMEKLKEELIKQMESLKFEEEKAEQLKLEEAKEMQLQRELDEIINQREIEEKKRRNKDYGLFLSKQYQLKLKRYSKQIQQQILEDKILLNDLQSRIQNENYISEQIKLQARQDVDKANIILKQLIEREKIRDKQMEFIFNEDAKLLWEKQEIKWNSEREARNKLLSEIFSTLRQQIDEKLARNLELQKQMISEREELLKNVETAHAQYINKQKEIEEINKQWTNQVQAQIIEKDLRKKEKEIEEAEEKEKERQREVEEEIRLSEELEKMKTTPYIPPNRPRKRIVW